MDLFEAKCHKQDIKIKAKKDNVSFEEASKNHWDLYDSVVNYIKPTFLTKLFKLRFV